MIRRPSSASAGASVSRAQATAARRLSSSASNRADPCGLVGPFQAGSGGFGECGVMLGVATAVILGVAGVVETFERVLTQRLEQAKARVACGPSSRTIIDLAARSSRASRTSHAASSSFPATTVAASASKLSANTPRRSKTTRSRSLEQRIGPLDGRPQRVMPLDASAAPAGEEPEPVVEEARDLAGTHAGDPRRRELHRQGDAIQAATDLHDGIAFDASRRKLRWVAPAAIPEEPHRLARRDRLEARHSTRHAVIAPDHTLARHAERPPGSSPARAPPAPPAASPRPSPPPRRGDARSCPARSAPACPRGNRTRSRPATAPAGLHAQRGGDHLCDRSGSLVAASSHNHTPSVNCGSTSAATCIARRVLPTPPTPVRVTRRDFSSASATAATLVVAAHERRQLHGQIPGERIQRPQRRERPARNRRCTTWNTRSAT